MKGLIFISLSCFGFPFFFSNCLDNKKKVHQWTKEETKKFIDSSEIRNLVTVYNEAEAYSFLLKNNDGSDGARKVTCVVGYPNIVDSLIQLDKHKFRSIKNRTMYFVNDSEVVITFFQKIIHPSSNWQGQTPWCETSVTIYPRLDRKLK